MNLKATSAIIDAGDVLLIVYGAGLAHAEQGLLTVNTHFGSSCGQSPFMKKGKGTDHFGRT